MHNLKPLQPELIVVSGCMFGGKSEEIIRQLRRYISVGRCIQVFKPEIDTRYSLVDVVSHNGLSITAQTITHASDIVRTVRHDTEVVAIDEVQFLNAEIVDVCDYLIASNVVVIVAGLPLDFRGEGFGAMPLLLAKAERVVLVHAFCTVCGDEACRTQRIVNGKPANWNDPVILVGAQESYEARCRKHHEVPGKPCFM